jgi:RNA polymerase sigma factor (sigma-70 family)
VAVSLPIAEDDWSDFYAEYAPLLRKFIRRRVPPGMVEDALQDTFVRAFRSRHRFDPDRPLWPWLVTIALRATAEARRVSPRETPLDEIERPEEAPDSPYDALERRLRREAVVAAMAELSPRHRRVLARWEIDGVPYNDLAAREGLTPQALKSVLCRARHRFRQSYYEAADRIGVAGVVALVPLIRRVRARLARLPPATGGRVVEGALGSITIVALATAASIVPPGATPPPLGRPDPDPVNMASIGPAVVDLVVDDRARDHARTVQPVWSRPADVSMSARGAPRLPMGASGQPDLRVSPHETTASLTVGVTNPVINGDGETSVTVRCVPGLWAALCSIVRPTPLVE